ncbi:MAG: MarR family transcriptional regulator [Spirochaetaceae bacterium]
MANSKIIDIYNQYHRIHNQFSIIKRKSIIKYNDTTLFPAEMHLLTVINNNPSFTISEIASHLYITNSAASQIVKKLYAKGLLDKKRNIENERVVILSPTKSGKEAINYFMNSQESALGELLKEMTEFTPDQVETVGTFLSKMEEIYIKKLK